MSAFTPSPKYLERDHTTGSENNILFSLRGVVITAEVSIWILSAVLFRRVFVGSSFIYSKSAWISRPSVWTHGLIFQRGLAEALKAYSRVDSRRPSGSLGLFPAWTRGGLVDSRLISRVDSRRPSGFLAFFPRGLAEALWIQSLFTVRIHGAQV